MQIPADLRLAIVEACENLPHRSQLVAAAQALSDAYRKTDRPAARRLTGVDAIAYAATRMPATYAALRRVFAEIDAQQKPHTLLDIGAGTGAGAWAARDAFGSGCEVTCEERDPAMSALGRTLTPFAQWGATVAQPDAVVLSYVLGEVDDPLAFALEAWQRTGNFLIAVEPGTTKGFQRIHALRKHLAAAKATIIAPCPQGALPCPMYESGDWCHFAARVERTQIHRQLKGGELSHEDEKFSYLIVSKTSSMPPAAGARIVRHPLIEPGHIRMQVCTAAGKVESVHASKRDKDTFRRARKAEWGGRW